MGLAATGQVISSPRWQCCGVGVITQPRAPPIPGHYPHIHNMLPQSSQSKLNMLGYKKLGKKQFEESWKYET